MALKESKSRLQFRINQVSILICCYFVIFRFDALRISTTDFGDMYCIWTKHFVDWNGGWDERIDIVHPEMLSLLQTATQR